MKESIATLIRAALKVGGGALVSQGLITDGVLETAIGAIVTLVGIILGVVEAKKSKTSK